MSNRKIISVSNILFVISIILFILIVVLILGVDFNAMSSEEIVKFSLYTSYMKASCFLLLALGLIIKWWKKSR